MCVHICLVKCVNVCVEYVCRHAHRHDCDFCADFTSTASVNSGNCMTSSWSSDSSIACVSGSMQHIWGYSQMTVAAMVGTWYSVFPLYGPVKDAFSFDAPVLTGMVTNVPWSVGGPVSVTGMNFGQMDLTTTANLQSELCKTTSWSSTTVMRCHALYNDWTKWPMYKNTDARLTISDHRHFVYPEQPRGFVSDVFMGTAWLLFSFDSPTVSLLGAVNLAVSHNTLITVTGLNFGLLDYTVSAELARKHRAIPSVTWTSATSALGQSPVITRILPHFAISVASAVGTMHRRWSFDAPALSFSPAGNFPRCQGVSVTMLGLNFGEVAT